ncbi:MAG: hypothetical protein PVH58_08965, partial [Desulfobacterales bacterium]
ICRIFEALCLPPIGEAFLSEAFLVAKCKKLVDFAAMWMNVKFARLEVDYLKLRGPRTKLQRQQSA